MGAMPRIPTLLVAAVVPAIVMSGCGGSSSAPRQAQPTFSVSPCPSTGGTVDTKWPASLPSDLPKPDDATIVPPVQNTADGVHIVKFTTPTSLREGVLWVVDKLPKAGYLLGRGDAEASEADAPFANAGNHVRGLYRLFATEQCKTLWLLATVDTTLTTNGGSPLLPPHSPSGSPSPLPFG
jgi:hypothetical protein